MKVKTLQIKKASSKNSSNHQKRVIDSVIKVGQLPQEMGFKQWLSLLGQFVVVGGDLI